MNSPGLVIARVGRWRYSRAFLCAGVAAWALVRCALSVPHPTVQGTILLLTMLTIPVGIFVTAGAKVIRPPELRLERDCLRWRSGLRQRCWPWSWIAGFEQRGRGERAFVTFSWHPVDGKDGREEWLEEFTGRADRLAETLNGALMEARVGGAAASSGNTRRPPAVSRLHQWVLSGSGLVMIGIVIWWIFDLNTARAPGILTVPLGLQLATCAISIGTVLLWLGALMRLAPRAPLRAHLRLGALGLLLVPAFTVIGSQAAERIAASF